MGVLKRGLGLTLTAGIGLLVFTGQGCLNDRPSNLGQDSACRQTAECGPGLECVGQRCVPAPDGRRGQNVLDVGFGRPETDAGGFDRPDLPAPQDTVDPNDGDPSPDAEPEPSPEPPVVMTCEPLERECASNSIIRVCRENGQGYNEEVCAEGTFCQDGQCEARESCLDLDGDSFSAGPGCTGTLDCNDSNPQINPSATETCNGLDDNCNQSVDEGVLVIFFEDLDADGFGTTRATRQGCTRPGGFARQSGDCDDNAPNVNPQANEDCDGVDNNCDGRIDEGCNNCCQPGDCPGGTLCVDCQCRETPEDECLFQNQPCNPFRTEGNREFACIDFAGGDKGLCLGQCALNAQDPDSTCPESGSICAFETDQNQGICLLECDPLTQTGCFESQGCVALRQRGGCVPTGDGEEGQRCRDEEVFSECEAGLVCLQTFESGASCQRLCYPFASQEGLPQICDQGSACFSFADGFGLCLESLDQPEGSRCENDGESLQMCGEDVVCVPSRRGASECMRLCRFENGDEDCTGGGECRFSDFLEDDIGVCR